MINTNLGANVSVNTANVMKKDVYQKLTEDEKQELLSSLNFIGTHFERFVISFYEGYLHPQTVEFIRGNSKESLINMFSSAFNLIVSSIEQPIPLGEYTDILKEKHPKFKYFMMNKDLFVKGFMNALINSLKSNYNERIGMLWYKAVSNFTISMYSLLKN